MAKGKKQEDPNKVAQRKAERVAFVQSHPNLAPEVARQRFYVQTRAKELEAAGKEVDRAALRQKFQSGGVTREGFYTPADINRFNAARDNGSSLADAKSTPVTQTTPVAPSATNVPTPVKPATSSVKTPSTSYQAPQTTSSVKTPASSYQAPQTTTSLGQVVTPPSSYQAPRKGTPARGGEPGRGVTPPALVRGTPVPGGEPRPPVWESGAPVVGDVTSGGRITENGIIYKQPGANEGREFTAAVNRVFPQAPANPKALRQQAQARFERVEVPKIKAEMLKSNPMRAAEQARIDAGYVPAPYDWTNLYRTAAAGTVVAAEIFGMRGGPVGGALAAGTAYNLTNRLGNLLEQKTGFGGVEGDPGFKGDTTAKGFAIIAGGSLAGSGIGALGAKAVSKIPKIPSAIGRGWKAVQKWADDSPQVPTAPWKDAGVGSPGISTSVTPRTPWREGPITGGTKSPRRVTTPKVEVEVPKTTRVDIPGETQTPSGIIIPAPSTRQRAGRTVLENETLDEMAATNYNAFDEAFGKKAAQEPVSLNDAKTATVADQLKEDGVPELTARQQGAKKGWVTRRANQAKLAEQKVELKTTESDVVHFGPSEDMGPFEPTPGPIEVSPTDPKYKDLFDDKGERIFLKYEQPPAPKDEFVTKPAETEGLRAVEGNPRAEAMRNHPAFRSTLPEEQPKLSVVKDEAAPSVAPAKRPPTQRPNETDAAYAKRLDAWRVANEGEVFKAPAGFEQARGSISYQEKAMTRIEGGMSRTNRSRTTAFVSEPGMSPEGFPVQMEGESVMQFNIRASEFLKSRGKTVPQAPDNSFLAQGTPEPVSLGQAKAAAAADEIPPRPSGLKNAAWDPETKQWRSRSKNKDGEYQFVKKRTVYATEEERQAGTAARELEKQQKRKAARAAASAEVKVKAETIAASGGPDAEFGPFIFGGEPIGRSKVTLTPGEVPDWAQQNISLTTKPLSEGESAWLNKTLTPDEEAFFKELGNAKKRSAGRLTTRSTREVTPADVEEYLRRMRGMRHSRGAKGLEEGIDFGIDPVALSDTQRALEKEIEQVLGSDALTALKNVALRRNTPPLTQNIRGLESLAEIKASGEPLINKVVVRQPTPSASGRLREQAAVFFNAQGKVKGVSGADRIRTWNRLTQSDWFRQLQEREPTFANFLRQQNESLGRSIKPTLEGELAAMPKPMDLRQKRWALESEIGAKEKAAAAVEFDRAIPDTGLDAYDLKGDELVDGVKAGDFKKGTTVQQRSQAAEIERRLKAQTSLTRRIISEDQAAFGDINYFNRGFERGQQLDPMVDPNVTKDYGIVDEKGFTNISQSEFNIAQRELNQPWQTMPSSLNEAKGAEFEAQRVAIIDLWKQKKITTAEMNQRLIEARTPAFEAPSTGLPANPFQQEFGTQLPNDYVRELPESYGKVWDTSTWTDEMGVKREGRWITPQEAADKKAKQAAAQVKLTAKLEKEREALYNKEWFAAQREQLARTASAPVETPSPFDKYGFGKEWTASRQAEEARRVASLERKAAQIKAEANAKTVQTAEEFRLELKQKHEGTWVAPSKPEPVGMTREEMLMQNREEEARAMREMSEEGFDSFFMDLGDYFKD